MALSDQYTLYAAIVEGSTIDGITSQNIDHALTDSILDSDGDPYPRHVGIMEASPMIAMHGLSLAKTITAIPLIGTSLAATSVYLRKCAAKGIRTSGSAHVKGLINSGLAVLRNITAEQGGVANIGFELHPQYNGSDEPIVYTANNALGGTPALSEVFTVGPVKINGSFIGGVQSINVDFAVDVKKDRSDGDPYPTYVYIATIRPVVRIRVLHEILVAYGIDGLAQSSVDSLVYFRKLQKNGMRVADATVEHVGIAMDDGMITARTVSGTHPGTMQGEIQLTPAYDGSNAILALSAATAIS